jgi:hypothetical protein
MVYDRFCLNAQVVLSYTASFEKVGNVARFA